ncbi:hypothetical protein [Paenibacillus gorillae]|uniref:hypothetical protein n=1 Tax=Paenibacillus gorillae TaxID=1243662 RepID=UPI0004B28BB5|nr:hypothetical protein [Paenibacillus gorillae]
MVYKKIAFKKFITHFMLLVMVLSSLLPMYPVSAAGADENIVRTEKLSFLASQRFNFSSTLSNISVNLNIPDGYSIASFQLWMMTNSSGDIKLVNQSSATANSSSSNFVLNDKKLTLLTVKGTKILTTANGKNSEMYYVVNRRSNGKEWIVQGSKGGGTYYVTPGLSDSCWVNGLTVCTGDLPTKDNTGKTIDNKVRATGQSLDGTKVDGYAIEINDGLASPDTFTFEGLGKTEYIYKNAVIDDSVKITSAVPVRGSKHKVLTLGPGTSGKGKLSVAVPVNKSNTNWYPYDCVGCSGNAIAISYDLQTTTGWVANTYLYEGEVRVTYKKNQQRTSLSWTALAHQTRPLSNLQTRTLLLLRH